MNAIPGRHWVLGAVVLLAACSSEAPPQPLSGAQPGLPTTGSERGEAAAGPTAAEVHEARVKQLLARVGPDAVADLAKLRAAPVIEAQVDVRGDRFDARWRYTWVNGAAPLDAIAFSVPANAGRSQAAPVTLQGVEVDGVAIAAGGTTERWEVPFKVAPGAKVDLLLRFSGTAPVVAPGGESALEAVAELGRLVPVVPLIEPRAAFGVRPSTLVLAGCMPRAQGLAPALVDLEVVTDKGLEIDTNGEPLERGRKDGRVTQRALLVGVDDVAIVASSGLARVSEGGDAWRRSAGASGSPAKVLGVVRRAREDLQTRWGAGPEQVTLVSIDGLDGVAAIGGLVLVPAKLVDADKDAGGALESPDGAEPKGLVLRTLGGFLAHHPAQDEALGFALTAAIAEAWWQGRGADAAADAVLRQGFARAAALAVIAGKGGDKAERRALELALRVPVQLAFQKGAQDVVLAGGSGGDIAALKAGLFVEALGRHLGEPVMASLVAKLRAAGAVTIERFRAEVLALAPRPDETRALLVRWLDERHLAEDVGPLRPEVLLEYLVSDGAIGGLSSQLMEQLGPDQLGGRALELLGQGHELDAGLALTLLGEMAAKDADPAMKKWLTLGTKLLGDGADRKTAVEGLVEELGTELGIPEADQSRLRQLSTQLLDALRAEVQEPPPAPAPPPPQDP